MHDNKIIPSVLGAVLCAGLVPSQALAELNGSEAGFPSGGDMALSDGNALGADDASDVSLPVEGDESEAPAEEASVASVVRDGERVLFSSISQAISDSREGETVEVSGRHEIESPLEVSGGKSISLKAVGACTIVRGAGFPQSGGKPRGLVRVVDGSSLSLGTISEDDAPLVFDGQDVDSEEAVVTVDGFSSFEMDGGSYVRNGKCSWKPWAGVYVRKGSFTMNGGAIEDGFAKANAAVAVESGSSFRMNGGRISGNRGTYSTATIWTKGEVSMFGGEIVDNAANWGAEANGTVYALDGGSFSFMGGQIGRSDVSNRCGIKATNASLRVGGSARMVGSDVVMLRGSTVIDVSNPLTSHNVEEPLPIVLEDSWTPGRIVARFPSEGDARSGLASLSVRTNEQTPQRLPLFVDESDPRCLSIASGDAAGLMELLDDPFADNLGFELKDEVSTESALEEIEAKLDALYDGVEFPDKQSRYERLEYIKRQRAYLEANRDEIERSVIELSSLGSPTTDQRRTKQNFSFDNLDATGFYLEPGRVNELDLYVDADDPSVVSLAWRQVGVTDSSEYTSLGISQSSGLKNGVNRIVVDLTGKRYGYMLYMKNDAEGNSARVRLEAADANEEGSEAIVGSSLGRHPYYEHDLSDPGAFWDFVVSVKKHAALAEAGQAQDMAFLQMGDQGRAQFAMRASALAKAYERITSPEEALAYVEKSNAAIQERLTFFWAFDGFEEGPSSEPNSVSKMRVHTAFTKNVTYPSSMYATGRYFHMPEGSAASFLAGESMYGWGMCHEYGHVLDNSVTVVNEETNNMYSIAGARNGEILASEKEGRSFDASRAYHVNALRAGTLWDGELAKMAADSSYVPDWNEGGWGYYIWAHLSAWWNGTHYFDGWDYSGYDHAASPFSEEDAIAVEEWGAFGATMRILRSDAEAVALIEKTTAGIADGTSRKYNKIAMAYTMGTGYDFAEYLQTMGQQDLSDDVKAFCSQYPSMPRKVHYYSLAADAAELNGAQPYQGAVRPTVSAGVVDGIAHVEAEMMNDSLSKATIAYELYLGDELVGFSRTGTFSFALPEGEDVDSLSVVAYDVRLSQSLPGRAAEAPFVVDVPSIEVGEASSSSIVVDGPDDATYSYAVDDEGILEVTQDGILVAKSVGTTTVHIVMSRPGQPDSVPYKFTVSVSPRTLKAKVLDAETFAGVGKARAELEILEGSLLEGDELREVECSILGEDGLPADLSAPGTYVVSVRDDALGSNYRLEAEHGTLTVSQDEADRRWVRSETSSGSYVPDEEWTNGAVVLRAAGASGLAGHYDKIARSQAGEGLQESVVVEDEGALTHEMVLGVSSGSHAGALSSPVSVSTKIDRTSPEISAQRASSAGEAAPLSGSVEVIVKAWDVLPDGVSESSGVSELRVLVLDASGEILEEREVESGEMALSLSVSAERTVVASAVDRAGNVSESVALTVGSSDSAPESGGNDGGVESGDQGESGSQGGQDGDGSPDHGAGEGVPGDESADGEGSDEGNSGDIGADEPGEAPSGPGSGASDAPSVPGTPDVPDGSRPDAGEEGNGAAEDGSGSQVSAGQPVESGGSADSSERPVDGLRESSEGKAGTLVRTSDGALRLAVVAGFAALFSLALACIVAMRGRKVS